MTIEEELARAVNHAGWTCDGGSDEPSQYDDCEDCKRVCDKFAAALIPLVRRAQAEAGAKALRNLAERTRADFASHKMICGWVGALDDEADRIEQEVEHWRRRVEPDPYPRGVESAGRSRRAGRLRDAGRAGEAMSTEYVCEHGWRSPMPFIHELGPTTSAGAVPPVPVCYPVEQEGEAG